MRIATFWSFVKTVPARLLGRLRGHRYAFGLWGIARAFDEPVEIWDL